MNRRRWNEDDYYSKDYGDTWMDRIGGYLVVGVLILIVVGIVKLIEWLMH